MSSTRRTRPAREPVGMLLDSKQNENRMEALQAQVDRYEELERSARTEEFALGMREADLRKNSNDFPAREKKPRAGLADAASSSY